MFMNVCTYTCHAFEWKSEDDLLESRLLSYLYVGSEDQTQLIGLVANI